MPSYYYEHTYIFAVDNFEKSHLLTTEEFCSNCGVYCRTIHIGDKTYSVKDAVYEGTGEELGTWLPHLTQADLESCFHNTPTHNLQIALTEAHLDDVQICEFLRVTLYSIGQVLSKIAVDRCTAEGFFSS